MSPEARKPRERLKGEILKMLKGESGRLYGYNGTCAFCKKLRHDCTRCPISWDGNETNCHADGFWQIREKMEFHPSSAIPLALAIYMWLGD